MACLLHDDSSYPSTGVLYFCTTLKREGKAGGAVERFVNDLQDNANGVQSLSSLKSGQFVSNVK